MDPAHMRGQFHNISRGDFLKGRQEDAHEYIKKLMDPHERHSKDAETREIKQIFKGKVVSKVCCQQCDRTSESTEQYMDVSLEIGEGITTIKEALAAYTKTEHLEGDNEYWCEDCGRKRQATKTVTAAGTAKSDDTAFETV